MSIKRLKRAKLKNLEINDTNLDESDSDFDDLVYDIAMMDTDFPDPCLNILRIFTLALPTCYPLYLGFRRADEIWNKTP